MDDGPYAFGERVEARLVGAGETLALWVGITTIAGQPDLDRCLGILPQRFLEQLATEIHRRLRPVPLPPASDSTDPTLVASGRRQRKARRR